MNARWSLLMLTGLLAAGLGLAAKQQDAPRPPKKWQREAAAFKALPAESQRRIRQLDRDLQTEDSENRDRYLRLLQRYNDWVEGLSPEERRSIEELPINEAKIKRIRELKEQQWIATLPKADRDQILDAKITSEEKQKRIATARERERQTELDWQMTLARMDERGEAYRAELMKWRQQILDQLPPEERKAKEQEWRTLRPPALRRAIFEEALKRDLKLPDGLRPYPPVDNVRLKQFMQNNPKIRSELEGRLLDPEKREMAWNELLQRFWEKHQDELRMRDKMVKDRKAKP